MLKLHPAYRFINFVDIGEDMEAMLLENRNDT